MILRRVVTGLAFLTPLWCAAQSAFVDEQMRSPAPLHPTVLVADYKNQKLPIVNAAGMDPEVEYDGKLKKLSSHARYLPLRAMTFAPGSIEIEDQQANSQHTGIVYHFSNGSEVSGGTADEHSDYGATVVPSESYKDCYLAVLFFDQGFMKGTEDPGSIIVFFQHIDDLVAGKPAKVRMKFGYMDEDQVKKLTFFPLIFSGGREIKSNLSEYSAIFFRRLELVQHEKILSDYIAKNVGKDAPLKPYVRVMPKLPDKIDLQTLPAQVDASFMVDEEGTVYSVQIETPVEHEAEEAIHDALRGWLFLPRLKEGRAIRTMVRVPIKLH